MSSSPYILISTDGHAGANLWDYKPYLEARWHNEFDEWAKAYSDAWADVAIGSESGYRAGAGSSRELVNWDSAMRQEALEAEGIVAEVLFPNTSPPFFPSNIIAASAPRTKDEYEHRWAGVRAHNRWLVDFCDATPGRRFGLAQLFLNDVDAAIEEVRWAKDKGLRGVLLPPDHHLHLINLYYPSLDPLWAACQDLDMPLVRHGVIVASAEPGRPDSQAVAGAVGLYEAGYMVQRPLFQLILAGVFERYPNLTFVLTEASGAGWTRPVLDAYDGFVKASKIKGSIPEAFAAEAVGRLSMLPSEYFSRNVTLSIQLSSADVAVVHEVGLDNLMWGADFPHREGTAPYTIESLRYRAHGVPENEMRSLLSDVAARIYKIDLKELQNIANRVGPSPELLATPLASSEAPTDPMFMMGLAGDMAGLPVESVA
jgi:predicted TIM-barrel fold metal-dependent hydrolase